jgi:class 3 adenylate cyclase/Tfp pilus assembly protein PilF/TolB-like protein
MTFPTDTETRKLAAIMFTDIKGFSKKMADNETGAFELLKTHDALLRVLTAKFDGRVIKSIGDSFMIDFASAVNAVRCAIEAQKRFSHFNKGKSEFDRIEIRVGVHLGDVIIRGEDIIGDGVNVASRIEAITAPNRICISQDVYQQVRNKIPLKVFSLGPQRLKNIPEPVEVYEILIDSIPELSVPSTKAKEAQAHHQDELGQKQESEEANEAKQVEEAKQRAKKGFEKKEEELKKKIAEHYANAESYFAEGKLNEAEAELHSIYQLDPQQRVTTERKRAEEEQEKTAQVYIEKARDFLSRGQLEAAEGEVNEIFRMFPLHVGAQQLLMQIEEERYRAEEKERSKRVEAVSKQVSKEERRVEELLERSHVLLQEENFTEAKEVIQEILFIDPNNSGARRFEESIRQAEQAKAEMMRIQAEQLQEEQHLQELTKLQQKVEEQRKRQVSILTKKEADKKYKRLGYIAAALLVIVAAFYNIPRVLEWIFPKTASIAIMRFTNNVRDTNDVDLFDVLPVLLAEDFAQCEHLTVISPSSSLLFIPEQANLGKIASIVAAEYVLIGTIQEERGRYTVLIRLFIPSQQKIATIGSVEGTLLTLNAMRTKILQKVLERLEVKSKLPEIAQPTNLNAFAKYLKGLRLMQVKSGIAIDSAITVLRSAVQTDPTLGMALGTLADAELRAFQTTSNQRYLRQAVEHAQQTFRINSNNSSAHRVLAENYALTQNYSESLSSYTQSLILQPQNPDCYRGLSRLALIAGKYEDADSYASRALLYDPKNAESYFTLAITQHMKQEYLSAENSYQQALLLGEYDSLMTTDFIQNVWVGEDHYNKVISFCQQMLQKAPKDYRYHYWMGRSYQFLLQVKPAQEEFEVGLNLALQSIELNANDAHAFAYVGLFYSRLGKFPEGESAMKRALQIDSTSYKLLFLQANLYSIQRNKQKVLNALDIALQHQYEFSALVDPDLSFIIREPEYIPAITRKIEGSWPTSK